MNDIAQSFTAGASLIVFAIALHRRSVDDGSNWFKIGMACWGINAGLHAMEAFSTVRDASSAQLFMFVCCVLGAAGGALLVTSIRSGHWTIVGLRPEERSSSAEPHQPSA